MINVAPAVSAIATAFTLLGSTITVRRITGGGTFDPVTGQYVGRTVADRTFTGVISGREGRWANGMLVPDVDFVAYLQAASGAVKPVTGEFLIIDADEVAIQKVDEYRIGTTDLAYRVVLVR